jgi:hypothetical protein
VQPFYLRLGLESIRSPSERSAFLQACGLLDQKSARLLLTTREWRGRKTVSWMIGVRRWDEFVGQIAEQLVASELVYAGQGYSVALALIANQESASGLISYLERWLPEHGAFYDQHWAMAALVEVDRTRGTDDAERFMRAGGAWDSWVAAQNQPHVGLAPVGEIVDLLRNGDSP